MADPADLFLQQINRHFGVPDPVTDQRVLTMGQARIGTIDCHKGGPDSIWISHYSIDDTYRAQGLGRQVLRELCLLADSCRANLGIEVFWRPGTEDGGWLPRLYQSCGFTDEGMANDQGYHELVRAAGAPLRSLSEGESRLPYLISDKADGLNTFDQPVGPQCRFLYRREEEELLALQIHEHGDWRDADDAEKAELDFRIKTGNRKDLDQPILSGMKLSSKAPDWACCMEMNYA